MLDKPALLFKSTGNDPYFTFPGVNFDAGSSYILEFELESEVLSTASLYFSITNIPKGPTTAATKIFSEEQVMRRPVAIGSNRLQFILNHSHLGNALRIDPLDCPGTFRIANVSLLETTV